jgi:hypothetical protein
MFTPHAAETGVGELEGTVNTLSLLVGFNARPGSRATRSRAKRPSERRLGPPKENAIGFSPEGTAISPYPFLMGPAHLRLVVARHGLVPRCGSVVQIRVDEAQKLVTRQVAPEVLAEEGHDPFVLMHREGCGVGTDDHVRQVPQGAV